MGFLPDLNVLLFDVSLFNYPDNYTEDGENWRVRNAEVVRAVMKHLTDK